MSAPQPSFDDATVTAVSKAVGELFSGTELTRVLAGANLEDVAGEGVTKWKRLHEAVAQHQNQRRNGKATIALIHESMRPSRTLDRIPRARVAHDALNQVLALSGLVVDDNGRIRQTTRAVTDSEAHARGQRLRSQLEQRCVHDYTTVTDKNEQRGVASLGSRAVQRRPQPAGPRAEIDVGDERAGCAGRPRHFVADPPAAGHRDGAPRFVNVTGG